MTQIDATSPRPTRPLQNCVPTASAAERSFARFHDVLMAFWFTFFLMNGLDKFFNAPTFFGVTRDAAFVEYFSRIGLPEPVAMFALYGIGVYEIALGVSFAVALIARDRFKTLILNNLELALGLFAVFALGDILFGDRKELWEHSCYAGFIILSYGAAQARVWLTDRQSQ